MASKVLVPAAPFTKLQVKKPSEGPGFIISGTDAAARVAHLEHSVRFLQEQHRLMLSGLHAEIEALRERNRDLQFQLIFNKESSPKSPSIEEIIETNEQETNLKGEVTRLEREAAAARGEARAAEARALQLQRLVDAQAEKLRELELATKPAEDDDGDETRAELRARLADAERLVRRLRADADRHRREVQEAGGVTNLLFDGALAQAHLQCMKNSLHASLRASGLDQGYGYQNNYFPAVHAPEFWREPIRDEFASVAAGGRGRSRRPLTLPELAGQQIQRSTVYANNHARPRANGYDQKTKKAQVPPDTANGKTPEEPTENPRLKLLTALSKLPILSRIPSYPELKVVVTKMIPRGNVSQPMEAGRPRPRRHHHRKHATDHT